MKLLGMSFLRRLLKNERGQTTMFVVLGMTASIGFAGIVIEVGHGYYGFEELQASTNAAALAGAAALPNTTTASSYVAAYSSQSGEKNANNVMLQNVVATPTYQCLTTVTNLGTPCQTTTGVAGGYNAIKVVQTAQVPLWIGKMFGMPLFNISATSTAAMAGGSNTPWNIAVIMDTTASMNGSDGGTQCSGTQIQCALLGFQALLQDAYPCEPGTACTSSSVPVDSIALFAFPPITTATMSKDYVCNTSNPTISDYVAPTLPSTATYEVVPFSTNYRLNDLTTTGINASSTLGIAAGASGISGCAGLAAPGGAGTYYAQAIYAAQAALVTQATAYPGSKNAMIILSDGDATASAQKGDIKASSTNSLNGGSVPANSDNGSGTNGNNSFAYPSNIGECGQAVIAAQAATTAGTTVFTIGYGSETSGCLTDSASSATVTTGGGSWGPGDSPCQALAAMASKTTTFYSDDGNGCKATSITNQQYTQLTAIFKVVINGLTVPRLIPNGSL